MSHDESNWWYVATLGACVVLTADDKDEAEMSAFPLLKKIIGNGRFVIRTVRPATADEIELHVLNA